MRGIATRLAGRTPGTGLQRGDKSFVPTTFDFDQGAYNIFSEITPSTYRITPHITPVAGWFWYAVRSGLWAGKTPHFLIAKANAYSIGETIWSGMWSTSPDTNTWYSFDHVTIGDTDIEFFNDTVFPSGVIYVARLPMYPFSRTQRKINEWGLAPYVSDTPSSTNFIIGNATPRPAQNNRTAPNLPFYGFKISKGGENTKNIAILSSGNHPQETPGRFAFEKIIDWLLAGSIEAEFLLDWFDFYCYPCVNPQGVWAGYSRTGPQVPNTDHNSYWNTTGTGEDIDAFKAAMLADTGGAIAAGFDFHSYAATFAIKSVVTDSANAVNLAFKAQYKKYEAAYDLLQEVYAGCLHNVFEGYGSALSMTFEQGQLTSRTVANYIASGEYVGKSLAYLQAGGRFTNGLAVGSREFNGTTDRIDWANVTNTKGAKSVSLWIYLDTNRASQYFLNMGDGDTYGCWIATASSAGMVQFSVNATSFSARCTQNSVATTGEWFHLIGTHTGVIGDYTSFRIYKNGSETPYYDAGSVNGSGTETNHTGHWSIGGRRVDDIRNTDGKIAQVGVWNRVLTPTEITNLSTGYAPNLAAASGLLFYFKGNTADLSNEIGGDDGTADGTTSVTGASNGPAIIYP